MIANLLFRANERFLGKSVVLRAANFTSSPTQSAGQSSSSGAQSVPAKTSQSKPVIEEQQQKDLEEFQPVDRPLFYHDQMEFLDERQVRISKPTKNVMQSGTAYTNTWKIDFDSKERWEYWLIGWASSKDPLSNMSLTFPSKEDAIAFCDKNKLQWYVEDQPERKVRRKSYADNFAYKKRYRLGNK